MREIESMWDTWEISSLASRTSSVYDETTPGREESVWLVARALLCINCLHICQYSG